MARSSLHLVLDTRTPVQLTEGANGKITKIGRPLFRKIVRSLEGALMGGPVNASHLTVFVDGAQPVAASAVITCSGVLAADTVTIGGQVLTAVSGAPAVNQFDMSGTDTADATSLAAAVALSNQTVLTQNIEACNLSQTITLATCVAGTRIYIAGHEFVAQAAANSTPQGNPSGFDISGNDTSDATALVNAINAHPVLSHQVKADSSAGVVTVRQRRGTTSLGSLHVAGLPLVAPSGVTLGGASFAAGASVLFSAKLEGALGNAVAVASSNGSRLAILGSATLLAGGTGSNVSPTRIVLGGRAE